MYDKYDFNILDILFDSNIFCVLVTRYFDSFFYSKMYYVYKNDTLLVVILGDNLRGLHTNSASKEDSRLTSLYFCFLFFYHTMIYYHIYTKSVCIF